MAMLKGTSSKTRRSSKTAIPGEVDEQEKTEIKTEIAPSTKDADLEAVAAADGFDQQELTAVAATAEVKVDQTILESTVNDTTKIVTPESSIVDNVLEKSQEVIVTDLVAIVSVSKDTSVTPDNVAVTLTTPEVVAINDNEASASNTNDVDLSDYVVIEDASLIIIDDDVTNAAMATETPSLLKMVPSIVITESLETTTVSNDDVNVVIESKEPVGLTAAAPEDLPKEQTDDVNDVAIATTNVTANSATIVEPKVPGNTTNDLPEQQISDKVTVTPENVPEPQATSTNMKVNDVESNEPIISTTGDVETIAKSEFVPVVNKEKHTANDQQDGASLITGQSIEPTTIVACEPSTTTLQEASQQEPPEDFNERKSAVDLYIPGFAPKSEIDETSSQEPSNIPIQISIDYLQLAEALDSEEEDNSEKIVVSQELETKEVVVQKVTVESVKEEQDISPATDTAADDNLPSEPTNIETANIEPSNIEPANIEPNNIEPTNIEPTNIEPANIEPTNIEPTNICLLYTSPSPRDGLLSRMPSSA